MKARFPVLGALRRTIASDDDLLYLCQLQVACFILHNVCVLAKDTTFIDEDDPQPTSSESTEGSTQFDDGRADVTDDAASNVFDDFISSDASAYLSKSMYLRKTQKTGKILFIVREILCAINTNKTSEIYCTNYRGF